MISLKRFFLHPIISLFIVYALAGLVIYSRVILQAGFVFDDFEYVVGNPIIQDMSSLLNNYSDPRQLGYFSFALNYLVGGEEPFGFHLGNVIIHIANGFFVFLLAGLLLKLCDRGQTEAVGPEVRFWLPAAAGLLFVVHPLQTQAVSYVTQRFTSLAAFFYLSALVLYLSGRLRMAAAPADGRAKILYVLALISTAAAMKVKEISFTLPVVLALLDFLFFTAPKERSRFPYLIAPFIATMVIIPFSILGPDWGLIDNGVGIAEVTRKEKIFDLVERPVNEYFATQLRVLIIYLRLLFFPYHQSVVYDVMPSRSFFDLWVILSLLFHGGILGTALFSWRRAGKSPAENAVFLRLIAVGLCWFYLTASVESSFLPIKDLIFEHRAYLPGVGIILASLSAVFLLLRSRPLLRGISGKTAVAAVAVLSLILGTISFIRNNIWLNELNLWSDVVEKIPNKAIGYHNRGNALARNGMPDRALLDINRTIAFFESYIGKKGTWETSDYTPTNLSKTYMNRATVYRALGKYDLAAADDETAKRLVSLPTIDLEGTRKMADIYYRRGAYRHAAEEYGRIIDWFPADLNALNDRGNSRSMLGDYKGAISDFDQVIRHAPDWPLPYHNRGFAHARNKDRKHAAEDFGKACQLGFPQSCESLEELKQGRNK